ncbi:uncharacterized protein V6R79_023886 [Siganus canaliculatus]
MTPQTSQTRHAQKQAGKQRCAPGSKEKHERSIRVTVQQNPRRDAGPGPAGETETYPDTLEPRRTRLRFLLREERLGGACSIAPPLCVTAPPSLGEHQPQT